jgi:tetratricopeptide (TPR) repeat protein
LVDRFPDLCASKPELVAFHYSQAGVAGSAIDYWQRAGERSVARFANAEAIAHFSKGLELISDLPESAERRQQELALQAALGGARAIHDGWQAPGTVAAYERAYELCRELPDTPGLFWILWQLGAHYQSHDLAKGNEIARQLVTMANVADDPALLVEANFGLSAGLVLMGKLGEAREIQLASEQLYDSGVDRTQMSPSGQNIAINNLLYLGLVDFLLGEPEKGLQHTQQAMTLATEHAGPPHQAAVLCWEAFQLALNGESERTLANAEEAMPMTTDFYLGRLWAGMLRGWALAHQDETEEAIRQMNEAGDAYQATGIKLLATLMMTLQADGMLACGDIQKGLDIATEAIRASEDSGEVFLKSELHRITGEAHLGLGHHEAATRSLRTAQAIAEDQGAKALARKTSRTRARLPELP